MKLGYRAFFIISILIFFLACSYYYPFISDDSLISLRYAQRFIEGKGLSWNDGHPVEGYSNLLWILGASTLGKLGINLILSVRILGILCSIGTVWVMLNYFKKQNIKKEYVFFAITLLVTTPCFAVWAIGGLEQPLYILLLTLVLIEVLRIINTDSLKKIYSLSIWLGLLAITRPDGFIFTILTSSFLLFINRKNKTLIITTGLATIVIPSLFLLSQLLFRYSYYGELVPNTALVKVKFTIYHILRGGFYHVKAFFGTFLLSSLGVYFLYNSVFKKRNPFAFYLLLNTIAWVSYVTSVGGDIFPSYRHYYVVLILFTFAIIIGLNINDQKINLNNKKIILGAVIILITNTFIQFRIPENQNAANETWEFRGMQLGEKLKNTFSNETIIAVTASGCIPYTSELPSIDMLGLNDYYIPRHPPANFGTGSLGHELGDANYVMRKKPDIIIFSTGSPMAFNIGNQLKNNRIFMHDYIKILAREKDNPYILFFNKYGTNAGIKLSETELKIPGYLFSNARDQFSKFEDKKLLKDIRKDYEYELILKNSSNQKWILKATKSNENVDFHTSINYQNEQLKIIIKSTKNSSLEYITLEKKY